MQGRTTLLGTGAADLWQVLLRSESSGVISVWWSWGCAVGERGEHRKEVWLKAWKQREPCRGDSTWEWSTRPWKLRIPGFRAGEGLYHPVPLMFREAKQSKAEPQLRGVEQFKSQSWFEAKQCESLVLLTLGQTDFLVFSFLISDFLALIPFYNGKPFNFWVSYFKIVHPVLMVPRSPDENVFNWNEQWLRSPYPCYCGFILLTTVSSIRECATELTGDWRQLLTAQSRVLFSGVSCVSGWRSCFFPCFSSLPGCELLEGLVAGLWSLRILCVWLSESVAERACSGSRLAQRLPQSLNSPPQTQDEGNGFLILIVNRQETVQPHDSCLCLFS